MNYLKTAFLQITTLSILLCSCYDLELQSNQFINDPNNPIVKGKLRSKVEVLQNNNAVIEYYYNNLGYLTKEVLTENEGPTQTRIYERNSDGLKIKEYTFRGTSAPSEIWTYTSYEYSGIKLKRKIYTVNRKIKSDIIYEYLNDLLKTSVVYKEDEISYINYEYDLENRVSKIINTDPGGNINSISGFEYRQDTTVMFGLNEDDTIIGIPYQKIYNSYGNIVEEAYLYVPPFGRRVTNQFIYDNMQRLIESRHYDVGVPTSAGPLSIFNYYYF